MARLKQADRNNILHYLFLTGNEDHLSATPNDAFARQRVRHLEGRWLHLVGPNLGRYEGLLSTHLDLALAKDPDDPQIRYAVKVTNTRLDGQWWLTEAGLSALEAAAAAIEPELSRLSAVVLAG